MRDHKIPLIPPVPNQVGAWINTGLRQNFNLLATKYSLEAARQHVKAQSAGNWPVFALQGNTQSTLNNITPGNDSFFVPNSFRNTNIAVAMHFPIFQGGLVASQTRQAIYQFQTSSEQLEQAYRNIVADSHITFNSITDGLSKVSADRQTLLARMNQLSSTLRNLKQLRTMVDVTNAQERYLKPKNNKRPPICPH